MGWLYEGHAARESYVIGYVVRDGCAPEAGLYRELAYPRDDGDRRVACIAAGCDCGWRSPRCDFQAAIDVLDLGRRGEGLQRADLVPTSAGEVRASPTATSIAHEINNPLAYASRAVDHRWSPEIRLGAWVRGIGARS